MQIKGVKGGTQRGDIVEFTPQEKAVVAVQLALQHGGPGQEASYKDFLVSVDKSSVKLDKFNYSPQGEPLKKKWQNNHYSAEGEAKINLLHLGTDSVREPRKIRFRMRFRDMVDRIGQPDLEITHFELRH